MYGNILYGCGSLSTPQKNRYIQSFVKYVNSVLNVIFYKKKKCFNFRKWQLCKLWLWSINYQKNQKRL